MPLSDEIVRAIRDEIGKDTDFVDQQSEETGAELDSLERIFASTARGNGSILVTALICWRLRLNSLQARSFDVSTSSTLLARNQRISFIERRIKELELLVDQTVRGQNFIMAGPETDTGAEFS